MSPEVRILQLFPGLDPARLRITSPETSQYNCIAYAAGDTTRFWWPDAGRFFYWPRGVVRSESFPAFQAAYESVGFTLTNDYNLMPGVEKIAIFHKGLLPIHAAKQNSDGLWSSKLGHSFDIQHDLEGMQGEEYGKVAFYMERLRA